MRQGVRRSSGGVCKGWNRQFVEMTDFVRVDESSNVDFYHVSVATYGFEEFRDSEQAGSFFKQHQQCHD